MIPNTYSLKIINHLKSWRPLFLAPYVLWGLFACQSTPFGSSPASPPGNTVNDPHAQNTQVKSNANQHTVATTSDKPVSPDKITKPKLTEPPPLSVTKQKTPKAKKKIRITPIEAARLLYPKNAKKSIIPPWKLALNRCSKPTAVQKIRCLLKGRYSKDKRASKLAIDLYNSVGVVAGLRPPMVRTGGWRGTLHMVPELPIGRRRRKHLRWVTRSFKNYKRFFTWLDKSAPKSRHYRFTHISFKFYQTLGKRTPSASAWPWNVAYNLNGSLLGHEAGVRETLYHELFHLNDSEHNDWSYSALKSIYNSILKRCKPYKNKKKRQGRKYQRCLRPYAPNRTRVKRHNVFYAFHEESDVGEYAAELAVRYYLEHRAVMLKLSARTLKKMLGQSAPGSFKCGPSENAKAWKLIAVEFYGGADLTPPCP